MKVALTFGTKKMLFLSSLINGIFSFYFVSALIENSFPKCCAIDGNLIFRNGSFLCDNNNNNNTAIYSDIKIIHDEKLLNVSDNYCVEVIGQEVIVFEKRASLYYIKLFSLDPNFYPKCCPIGYVYNTVTHACEESNSLGRKELSSFRFARIGLSHCKIIIDYKLRFTTNNSPTFISAKDYCIDDTPDDLEVIRVCTNDYNICRTTKCIHKCCQDGYSFVNGSICQRTPIFGVNLNFSEFIDQSDDFAIIHGYNGKIYLQPLAWHFHLDSNGIFRLFDEKIGHEIYEPTEETYCIEHATKKGIDYGYRLFRKYPETQIEPKFIINGYVMIVSSIFLLLTIICYVCSGESKKLFGKTLVSFCLCLIIMNTVLVYSTFNLEDVKGNKMLCHTFGFLLLYIEFSTFLWLKLLCFDIYYTFGSGKMRAKSTKNSLKRFLLYSFYGWGLALVLTCIPLSFFYADVLPEVIEISVGVYRCAIDRVDGNYADLLFRTVPVTIIQIINIFLFYKTVKCCIDVKNEIRRINDNEDGSKKKFLINRERFALVTKLSVIMGISYIFEVVSSFYDFNQTKPTKYLEIVWDIINCLQGVFIFIIFICKKKMAEKLKCQAGIQKLRKISFSSGATLTTHLSFDKDKRGRQTS